ncbi:MAG TPA: orotidine-5'-phosphate decarboxylase [Syntrophobacteria bacterium]|nr:orotidine-5'-phosphate decarboxylase [Syntrophobacteria bacterium]
MIAKDRLIFPLDVPDVGEAVSLVALLRDHVGVFKIGLELFVAAGPPVVERIAGLTSAAIFLDLKLHDIPETVRRAVRALPRPDRVTFLTVHCDPGLLAAVMEEVSPPTKILAVTVLTSLDSTQLLALGIGPELAAEPVKLVLRRAALAAEAGCHGVVCSGREVGAVKRQFGDKLLTVVPGIRPAWSGSGQDDQRRVTTPYEAVREGADYIVVGRPIRDAAEPRKAAAGIVGEIERALEEKQRA